MEKFRNICEAWGSGGGELQGGRQRRVSKVKSNPESGQAALVETAPENHRLDQVSTMSTLAASPLHGQASSTLSIFASKESRAGTRGRHCSSGSSVRQQPGKTVWP